MNRPPPSSERSVNDIAASCPSGASTKRATNMSAGARKSQPCPCPLRRARAMSRLPRKPLFASDLLHLLARLDDRPVDVAIEDRALEHVDPGARIRVHHVSEMVDPRHVADAERLGRDDD